MNKAVIAIERRATPQEMGSLLRVLEMEERRAKTLEVKSRFVHLFRGREENEAVIRSSRQRRLAIKKWISHLLASPAKMEKQWDRPFISKGMALYRNPTSRGEKFLLIGFCGAAQRLMMPLHRFLNSVHELGVDVLILWAKEKSNYIQGIPSLGDNLESSLQGLRAFVQNTEYREIGVIGTSGGGIPAAIFALGSVNAPYLVAGSQHPEQTAYAEQWIRTLSAVNSSGKGPTGVAIVGSAAPQADASAATYLQLNAGTSVLVKPGGHNPLNRLALQGKLGPLIQKVFCLPKTPPQTAKPIS